MSRGWYREEVSRGWYREEVYPGGVYPGPGSAPWCTTLPYYPAQCTLLYTVPGVPEMVQYVLVPRVESGVLAVYPH